MHRTLHYLLRGTGRRRAQDHAVANELARVRARLAEADSIIAELWCHAAHAERQAALAQEERALFADACLQLLADAAGLTDRLTAANAEIANLRAISSPAPADLPASVPAALAVTTLWDAHGLRTAA